MTNISEGRLDHLEDRSRALTKVKSMVVSLRMDNTVEFIPSREAMNERIDDIIKACEVPY